MEIILCAIKVKDGIIEKCINLPTSKDFTNEDFDNCTKEEFIEWMKK